MPRRPPSAKTGLHALQGPALLGRLRGRTEIHLGSTSFTEQEIVDFARQFDPQSFHVDAAAAASMFGGIIASGWHIASKMMRLFVDNYVDHRTALGSPGLDELRWLKPVRPGDR